MDPIAEMAIACACIITYLIVFDVTAPGTITDATFYQNLKKPVHLTS